MERKHLTDKELRNRYATRSKEELVTMLINKTKYIRRLENKRNAQNSLIEVWRDKFDAVNKDLEFNKTAYNTIKLNRETLKASYEALIASCNSIKEDNIRKDKLLNKYTIAGKVASCIAVTLVVGIVLYFSFIY
jgi:hypothetical protein